MAKYIDSLNKGLSAAKDAERNREEIAAIFRELNEQLAIATDGKVAIERIEFREPSVLPGLGLASIFDRKKYWALAVVFLPSKTVAPAEIARWEQDNSGYPCRVMFGVDKYYCDDKAGLEGVLETLLADAAVGEVLHKYMTMPLPVTGN